MGLDKKTELENARLRRAKIFKEFTKSGLNQSEFAKLFGFTRQRLAQILMAARNELNVRS